MGHFLEVCAYFIAKIGDHVGVTDFQREERIGGVLDELGAVDGGDEEFGFAARRAGSVVHRAAETFFENRAVDFAELRGGGGILDADNNPVRMEKIRDRSEEHTSELQSQSNLVCRLLLEKKKIRA